MKPLFRSTYHLILYSLALLVFIPLAVVSVISVFTNQEALVPAVVAAVFFTGAALFFGFMLNRLACRIWIENDTVKRKGFFFGFYKDCPIASVRQVVLRRSFGDGTYLYIVDDSKHRFDCIRQDSYICFPNTPKANVMIATFLDKTIDLTYE